MKCETAYTLYFSLSTTEKIESTEVEKESFDDSIARTQRMDEISSIVCQIKMNTEKCADACTVNVA